MSAAGFRRRAQRLGDIRFSMGRRQARTIHVQPPREHRRRVPPGYWVPLGFAAIILAGTVLLMLPIATTARETTSAADALFVAASAVSTTGLSPVDTRDHWSAFGEAVILLMIMVGGLGFMAGATLALVLFRRRISMAVRLVTGDTLGRLGAERPGDLVRVARGVVLGSMGIQVVGAALLFGVFALQDGVSVAQAWRAVFTSASAFNTAGFDIEGGGRGLTAEATNAPVIAIILVLSLLGGTGYAIWADVLERRHRRRLTVDTKLVFLGMALLWVGGSAAILLLESGTSEALGTGWVRASNATFTAISGGTTVGFSTINIGALRDSTTIILIALMFVGAAPASTGGGIKLTTWVVLLTTMLAAVRGNAHVTAFEREIAWTYVNRALTVALLGVAISFGTGTLLTATTSGDALDLVFEGVSAFGTVGLSRGVTSSLSAPAELVTSLAMYIGRVGPLTLALVFLSQPQPARYRYPQEAVSIG